MVVLRVLQDPRRKYISDVKPDAIGQLAHTLFRRSQSEYRTIARSFPPSREKKKPLGPIGISIAPEFDDATSIHKFGHALDRTHGVCVEGGCSYTGTCLSESAMFHK